MRSLQRSSSSAKPFFIRNMSAGYLFQVFMISAVSTILLTRAYLSLSGYPQIGGGSLHIAHVLWGGLLMLAAALISFASLSWRSTLLQAGLSGIGFGLFIDEIGKFVTKDNDYFFRPASVILYLLFLLLVLILRLLVRERTLTTEERSVNAMRLLEQMFDHDLQADERAQVIRLLKAADQSDPQVRALQRFVGTIPDHRLAPKSSVSRLAEHFGRAIRDLGNRSAVRHMATAVLFGLVTASIVISVRSLGDAPGLIDWIAALGSTLVTILVAIGSLRARHNPPAAATWYRRALVFDFLAVEPFLFYSEQFIAAYGLILKLLLWLYFAYYSRQGKKR